MHLSGIRVKEKKGFCHTSGLCGNVNDESRVDLAGGNVCGIVPTVCLSPKRL